MTNDESYYAAVESYFVERRGSPLFISPSEWHLVAQWEDEGIPLDVVREGIDRVFAGPRARRKRRKLGYCRQSVEAAYRRFREAALGSRAHASVDEDRFDAERHVLGLTERLREIGQTVEARRPALSDAIEETVERLRASLLSTSGGDLSELEEELRRLERRLLDSSESALEPSRRSELMREAEASLEDYRDRMPATVYQSALASAYRRRLRSELGLVRLSLFDR